MKSFKNFAEALKGNQHKIDKNKNGKIDAHDFKLLRKEEQELEEASYKGQGKVETKKYSWGTMKTVHHGSEFSIPLHPEHHEAIAKLKDQQEHKFKDETGRHWTAKRDGDKVHFQGANNGGKTSVAHSTMKEEVELDEVAKATGDLKDACWKGYTAVGMKMKNGKKVPNCVPVKEEKDEEDEKCEECGMKESECECDHEEDDKKEMKEGKHVVGVTISDPGHTMVSQRNEKKYRKAKVTAPDKDTAINTALAYYKKRGYKVHDHNYIGLHNEEVELDEARINGREYASQGVMHPDHAKMDIHKVSGQHVDFYASKTGDKMQGKVVKNDGKEVHIQAHKELGDGKLHKFKVTPNLPKPTNEAVSPAQQAAIAIAKKKRGMKEEAELEEKIDMAKAKMGDVIKDFQQSDAPQFAGKSKEKRRQMAIAAKLQADRAQKEEREVKSYKQFMEEIYNNLPELEEAVEEIVEDAEQLDEYESKDGVYRHTKKATYGTSYQGDDDEDEKPKKPEGEKRGRGRPAGSSSGARQKGSTAGKKRSGVEYTGYPLHLPGNK